MAPEDEADLRRLLLMAWNRVSAECVGKQGFATHNQAANAMHSRHIRSVAQAYRCSCCGLFHVGTRKK